MESPNASPSNPLFSVRSFAPNQNEQKEFRFGGAALPFNKESDNNKPPSFQFPIQEKLEKQQIHSPNLSPSDEKENDSVVNEIDENDHSPKGLSGSDSPPKDGEPVKGGSLFGGGGGGFGQASGFGFFIW